MDEEIKYTFKDVIGCIKELDEKLEILSLRLNLLEYELGILLNNRS